MRSHTFNDINTGLKAGACWEAHPVLLPEPHREDRRITEFSTRLLWLEFNCWFKNVCLLYYSFKVLSIISMLSEKRVKEEGLSRALDVGSLGLKGRGEQTPKSCPMTSIHARLPYTPK